MVMLDNTEVLLRESLVEFKAITIKLINAVNNDLSEEIDKLFIDRQVVITKIGKLQYSKEEFIMLSNELDIVNISKSLDELILKKREDLKVNMKNLSDRNIANKSYANSTNVSKSLFSTKI